MRYKGVHKTEDGYEARIFKEGRESHIGTYKTETEAAVAYDLTAEAAMGDLAVLNFPDREADTVVQSDNTPGA